MKKLHGRKKKTKEAEKARNRTVGGRRRTCGGEREVSFFKKKISEGHYSCIIALSFFSLA